MVYTDISQDNIGSPEPLPLDGLAFPNSSRHSSVSANIDDLSHHVESEADISYCTVQVHHKDLLIMVTEKIRASVQTLDVTGVLQYSTIEERGSNCSMLVQLFDNKIEEGTSAAYCMGSFIAQNH